jgi:DNA-binding transcriptional LysR family regulator
VDARQLTYFLAIVDAGGFGRAAERLGLAQPSLSQTVSGLERELQVRLFHRVGRRIHLTDVGAELVAPARRVLRDLQAAEDAALSVPGTRRGRVEIVSMPSPATEPLASLATSFGATYPGMVLEISGALLAEEVVAAVRSGVAEIGLIGATGTPVTAELRATPVERQSLVLVSPPDARLPPGDSVTRRQLDGVRLVASEPGSAMRQVTDELVAEQSGARIAVETRHRSSFLPLVLAGVGHAVMPSSWRELALRTGAQVRRLEGAPDFEVTAVTKRDELTLGARLFLAKVVEHAALAELDR